MFCLITLSKIRQMEQNTSSEHANLSPQRKEEQEQSVLFKRASEFPSSEIAVHMHVHLYMSNHAL